MSRASSFSASLSASRPLIISKILSIGVLSPKAAQFRQSGSSHGRKSIRETNFDTGANFNSRSILAAKGLIDHPAPLPRLNSCATSIV
ncbi:hypothetical protein [Shinella zoogloeoides]|uniref:hypothetical protein n=1 Tax=Shinella zoogloeoides TaxID=352475 RepID=UPI00299D1255|nr:hypothetical protein [Shinella zoogloeoides]